MNNKSEEVTIELQFGLNKRMYELGKITYDMYSKANEILTIRLTMIPENDIITHSKSKCF